MAYILTVIFIRHCGNSECFTDLLSCLFLIWRVTDVQAATGFLMETKSSLLVLGSAVFAVLLPARQVPELLLLGTPAPLSLPLVIFSHLELLMSTAQTVHE